MLQYTVIGNTVVKYNKNRDEYYTIPMYSANAIEIKFILDDSWKEYVITAQISNGEKTYNLLLQNNTAFIPADITTGIWNVSIFGIKGEEKRNTTIPSDFCVVEEGFKSDGQPPIPPEPDLYQKLLSEIQKGIEIAQSVRNDADAGKFDGEDGNGIERIELVNKVDKVTTYKIIFTNGEEFEYQITDGADGKNGVDGVGIKKIELVEKIEKTARYKITLTDGNYFEYEVLDGENGKNGITPEITINATVNNTTGTPSVSVEKTGTIENPIFNLSFKNLKGEKGENGRDGTDGKSATITIGEVKTVDPDNPAIVTNTGNETDAVFNFEIPRGKDGQNAEIDLKTLEKVAIKTFIDGNPAMSGSSAEWRIPLIEAYGKSTQGADPTPQSPQEIKSPAVTAVKGTGKNLFKMPQVKEWTKFNIEYVQEIDNGLICKPKGTYANCKSGLFKLKPNTNYSLSGYIESDNLHQSIGIRLFKNILNVPDVDRQVTIAIRKPVSAKNVKVNANFVTDELKDTDEFYLQLACSWQTDDISEVKFTKIQIEYGTTATEYESYKEKTISLSTPVTLRGIPSESGNVTIDDTKYLSDYIGKKEGVYGVFRKTREDFDDGSQNWSAYVSPLDGGFTKPFLKSAKLRLPGICNQGKVSTIQVSGQKNTIMIGFNNTVLYFLGNTFYNPDLPDKGLANWKAHLAENPLKIIAVADEEFFEPLPETDQQALADLKTFYPTSIISWETEDGIGAWTRAEIIHDPTNYIDEKLGQITAQQTALQAEILKIGGSI